MNVSARRGVQMCTTRDRLFQHKTFSNNSHAMSTIKWKIAHMKI